MAAATGGVDARVFGVTIRARGALRPLGLGLVLLAVYLGLDRRALRTILTEPGRVLAGLAPWLAVMLAAVTTIHAIRYGAFVASGSDSYGYLSEAYGWARGPLPEPYPVPLTLPTRSSDWIQTPLGYWTGRNPHTIVPSYAPGLPFLLAGAILLADPLGPYLVVPLCAGLFVWVTFLLGRRMAGPIAGLAATLIAASSPIVLFLSLWVMSDVPAGVMWTAAGWAALARSRRGAFAAGVVTALALLIRPNLAPLALVPIAWIMITGERAERWWQGALFCASVVPAAIVIGVLNAAWYGSPLLSGYGDASQRFGLQYVWPNLRHYPAWIVESQSPWIMAAAAASLLALVRASPLRRPVALAWGFVIVTLLCYLPYVAYEPWWYLRFLIPALGAFYALVAVGLSIAVTWIRPPWGLLAASAVLAVILGHSVRYVATFEMFGPFQRSEHRYADLGAFIARHLPRNAVIFAMQHSGSIRYYGGRHTLRYDLLDRDWVPRAATDLESIGLHPFLAIEDGELANVRNAFTLAADQPLPWPHVGRMQRHGGLSIYDLATNPAQANPLPIEPGLAPAYAAPLDVVIEPRRR